MTASRRLLPPPHRLKAPDFSLAIVSVVLLLILFFLASGAMVNPPDQGIDLAQTRDLPIDQLPRPLLVVDPDGGLALDGAALPPEALAQALAGAPVVHVLIDRNAPARELIAMLARAHLDGITVELVTVHRQEAE